MKFLRSQIGGAIILILLIVIFIIVRMYAF